MLFMWTLQAYPYNSIKWWGTKGQHYSGIIINQRNNCNCVFYSWVI